MEKIFDVEKGIKKLIWVKTYEFEKKIWKKFSNLEKKRCKNLDVEGNF